PREIWRFVRGVSRGLRMGHLFPAHAASRQPGAPGGSHAEPAEPGRAFGGGTPAVWRSHHRLPVDRLVRAVDILHLSDVHLRTPDRSLARLAALLSGETADLVVITGDLVTRGWSESSVRTFLDALPAAPLGRFAILGNWEHWSGVRIGPWRRLLAAHDVQLLVDEAAECGPITVVGTDDVVAGSPDLRRIGSLLAAASSPTVVLSHSPALFPALAAAGARRVLAGHSHGGQVHLPLLGPLWVPRGTDGYVAGWYHEAGADLFVHRGLGWSIAPLRLHCPPELACLHLLPGASP
ncbi:MAG: hypothetical protein D6798_01100, partial [Deltaproteobacteria bacterium]